jgi:hypothetical protein
MMLRCDAAAVRWGAVLQCAAAVKEVVALAERCHNMPANSLSIDDTVSRHILFMI